MNTPSISFSCPYCRAALTVPADLAGVSGPCPSCGQTIAAPIPEPSRPTWTPPPIPTTAETPGLSEPQNYSWEQLATPTPAPPWEQPAPVRPWQQPTDWPETPTSPQITHKPLPPQNRPPDRQSSPFPIEPPRSPFPIESPRAPLPRAAAPTNKLAYFIGIPMAILFLAGTAYVITQALKEPVPKRHPVQVPATTPTGISTTDVPINIPTETISPPTSLPAPDKTIEIEPFTPPDTAPVTPTTDPEGITIKGALPVEEPPENPSDITPTDPPTGPPTAPLVSPPPVDPDIAGENKKTGQAAVKQLHDSKTLLKAFFAAKDWKERSQYIIAGDKLAPYLQIYYEKNPDGPITPMDEPLQTILAKSPTGHDIQVYTVLLTGQNRPIPICVEQMDDGSYLVDWPAFAQFKDNALDQFFSDVNQSPKAVFFSLRSIPSQLTDVPDPNQKLAYRLIDYNSSGREKIAYVSTTAPIAEMMKTRFGYNPEQGGIVVGELAWNRSGSKPFVEIINITQENWRTDDFLNKTLKLAP